MRLNARHRTADERGVALVEFALIVPIFVLMIAGILAFGRVFFYWIEANHQANEAARWAAVDRNPYAGQTLQQHVAGSATVEFQSDVAVCIDYLGGRTDQTIQIGEPVRVKVQKPFSFIPFLGIGEILIVGTSTMRLERLGGTSGPTAFSAEQDVGTCT